MKNIFRYLTSVLFGAMTLAACQQEVAPLGTEISVNPATVSVAGQNAGNETVTVSANGDWIVVAPEWVTVAPNYGGEGETVVTLSFADNLDTDNTLAAARKATVMFSVNEKSAELLVEQAGDPDKAPAEVKQVTCAEFNAAEDGAGPFRVIGTITNIEQISPSTAYNNGNLTISDETGDLYLYRVGPGDGKKLEDLGLAVGDKITVEGKKGSYKDNPQMAQGGVILEVEKSLISVENVSPKAPVPAAGGEVTVTLTCKGEEYAVVIPKEASWLTVSSELRSGDLLVVELTAASNEGAFRTADVEFVTSQAGVEYKATVTVEQSNPTQEVKTITIPELYAKVEAAGGSKVTVSDEADFELNVIVSGNSQNSSYGTLYVMTKGATAPGNGFTLYDSSLEGVYNVGDELKVTLKARTAELSQYNGVSQVSKVTPENIKVVSTGNVVTPITVLPADLPKYLGMPVAVENATVAADGVWCTSDAHGQHAFVAADTQFTVYVNKRATVFQGVEYKAATGKVSGIAVTYKGNNQIAPCSLSDVADFAK